MSPDEYFARMAERIKKNEGEPFGGAFVAVPPGGAGVVELVVFDNEEKLPQFWALVQTRAQTAIQDAEAKAREGQGFGVARR